VAKKSSKGDQENKAEETTKKWDDTQRATIRFFKNLFDQLDTMVGTENPTKSNQ
jgi:uncharacterized SAM-dependent methyltransferase